MEETKKYNVKIYQVAVMGRVEIHAKSEEDAKMQAIVKAREGHFSVTFPDCGLIAMVAPENE